MNAGTKFAIGAGLIVASVGYLMASGVKETGQYFLTPTELTQKVALDPSFYNVGMRVGAHVVRGTVSKDVATQTLRCCEELETGFAHDGVIQPFLAVKVTTESGQIDAGVAAALETENLSGASHKR